MKQAYLVAYQSSFLANGTLPLYNVFHDFSPIPKISEIQNFKIKYGEVLKIPPANIVIAFMIKLDMK